MRKHPFTLIEILLVVTLIGLSFGVIAIQAPQALRGEKFERGVDQVKTRIALAQELMLDYQTDVILTLTPNPKGLNCSIETMKPIPDREINRHALIEGLSSASPESLFFDGTLGATPKGGLLLKAENREAILTLKGFPSSIIRGGYVADEAEATYPEAVVSFI